MGSLSHQICKLIGSFHFVHPIDCEAVSLRHTLKQREPSFDHHSTTGDGKALPKPLDHSLGATAVCAQLTGLPSPLLALELPEKQ